MKNGFIELAPVTDATPGGKAITLTFPGDETTPILILAKYFYS